MFPAADLWLLSVSRSASILFDHDLTHGIYHLTISFFCFDIGFWGSVKEALAKVEGAFISAPAVKEVLAQLTILSDLSEFFWILALFVHKSSFCDSLRAKCPSQSLGTPLTPQVV